ncbi:reverse transcriptase domain-containing protein [Tanacetum coccineum]
MLFHRTTPERSPTPHHPTIHTPTIKLRAIPTPPLTRAFFILRAYSEPHSISVSVSSDLLTDKERSCYRTSSYKNTISGDLTVEPNGQTLELQINCSKQPTRGILFRALLLDRKNKLSAPAPATAPVKRSGHSLVTTVTNPREDLKGITDPKLVFVDIKTNSYFFSSEAYTRGDKNAKCTLLVQLKYCTVQTSVGPEPSQLQFLRAHYFEPDPRVPLILGRCFLKTSRALIDVHKGELTLRIGRYSQEVLVFTDIYRGVEIPLRIMDPILNSSVDEPTEVELKELPPHLEYAFLEGDNKLPVIIAKELEVEEKSALIKVLKSHKRALAWKLSDIQGINPEFCTHKILMEEDYAPAVQHQRRVNPKIHDVIKKEVEKLLEAGLIYPISDSPWVSPIHCVPKKGGMTVVVNEENELIPTRLVTGWRVCIDYRKLNEATRKDHFPLPFMDQMLERLAGNEYYCFLDGFSGTFQRCMLAIFHDMVEKTMEVFMDDFSVFGNSFQNCLSRLDHMLQRCEDTNLSLNWEKSHFMVKEGIVLGHKISKKGIEVDKAKIDVIAKLPHPTTVKGIRSFLGHAGFYRRFIQDFSKISRPMTHLLEKNTPFIFSDDCIRAFQHER